MSISEQRYKATQQRVREFEEALDHVEDRAGERDPLYQQVLRKNLETELEEMYEQIAAYEGRHAQDHRHSSAVFGDSSDVPLTLVRVRIAAGLRQAELADRLGVPEEQIRTYEATRYHGASLDEVRAIASALGLRVAVLWDEPARARAS